MPHAHPSRPVRRRSPLPSSMRWRWCRSVWADQRGSVSAELVIAVPVLLLLLMLIAQFALWAHASHIAQAAATQALSATRVRGGTATEGDDTAREVLTQLGQGPLRNAHAVVIRGPEQSTAEVTGDAVSVLGFLVLPVRARAVGPTEHFVTPPAGVG